MALSIAVQLVRVFQGYGLGRGLGIQVGLDVLPGLHADRACWCCCCRCRSAASGCPQGVIVWLLRPVGVPDAESLALSTLLIVVGLVGNLPGALLYLRFGGSR